MQERLRIQSQLQRLREECVSDYLSSKLEFIASKEVVNDILTDFMQTNNQEFLESITQSIVQAKNQNKSLKQTIEALKKQHQAEIFIEREKVKQQSKQQNLVEMSRLKEQVNLIKMNLQAEGQAYISRVQTLKAEVESLQSKNQELSNVVKEKNGKVLEVSQAITKLTIRLEEANLKLVESGSMVSQLQARQLSSRQQFARQILSLKESYLKQEKQLQSKLQSQYSSLSNQQKHNYEKRVQQLQAKLEKNKQENVLLMNQTNKLNVQKQKIKIAMKECQQMIIILRESLKKAEDKLQERQIQLVRLNHDLCTSKQQNQELIQKISILDFKLVENNNRYLENVSSLKVTIAKLQQQNQKLSFAKGNLEEIMNKKSNDFLSVVQNHSVQIQSLRNQIASKQFEIRKVQQKLSLQVDKNYISQEEIKSLLKYNSLYQEQILKYECQMKRAQQQKEAQVRTYLEAFHLNTKGLEEQLTKSKKEISHLRDVIRQLQKQLEVDHERQKQYFLYLEEIALLKKELSKYQYIYDQQSIVNKARKSRILMEQLPRQVHRLQQENRQLKDMIKNQLEAFQEYFRQTIKLIINEMHKNSVQYRIQNYQNESEFLRKGKSPYQQDHIKLDKTIPRLGMDKPNLAAMKKNLKSINEKYQIMHSQNKSFTNRIETYLSSK